MPKANLPRLVFGKRCRLVLTSLALFACGITERRVDERDAGTGGGSGEHCPACAAGGAEGFVGSGFGGSGFVGAGNDTFGSGALGVGPPSVAGAALWGSGGKAGGGPPSGPECNLIPAVEPSCPTGGGSSGAPGAAGDRADAGATAGEAGAAIGGAPNELGGGGTGGAGQGETGGAQAWCVPDAAGVGGAPAGSRLLLDDLEDGDDTTPFVLNGRGAWFAVNDGSGQQFPLPCTLPSPLPAPRGDSHFAMRTYGRGFQSLPGAYSLVGMTFKTGPACSQPLDASAFTGVEFWARGSGVIRFFIGTVETNPTADFGTCISGCYDSHGAVLSFSDDWQLFRVPFVSLIQEGWGAPASFDPAHVLTLEWSAKQTPFSPAPASCFDFWIDDVALYR